MMARKINLTKNDTAETAVIKFLKVKDDEITLVVPNFSKLGHSLENFQFLKKEAEDAGKVISIESVDDTVVELARRGNIESVNPFFELKTKRSIRSLEPTGEDGPLIIEDIPLKEIEEDIVSGHKIRYGHWLALATVIIITVPSFYVAYKVLPQAQIKIVTQKTNWDYKASLLVDSSISESDVQSVKIPGKIITQTKNSQLFYLANGEKRINRKATGSITIYNNHSSAPQSLVASTRFETPDGKIFRLAEAVAVPGAKMENNKIIQAGSIVAKVIADRGGEEYNIGAVEKFTVPGFKNNQKFKDFYGASTEPMKGGFIGDSAYPTDRDIKEAKDKSALVLEDNLKTLLKGQIPEGFKIINGSNKFSILKQNINTEVNEKNEFSVFTEAEIIAFSFKEKDALDLLSEKARKELSANLKPKSSSLTYGEADFDLKKGTMTIPVIYESSLQYPIDKDQLKKELIGKSELELKALLFAVPGLASTKVSFWPFWVNSVPEKVDIEIE
jgi:hypothetical protein